VSPVELTDARGEGGRGGRGAKSYNREKAWPSVNNSILSLRDQLVASLYSTLVQPTHSIVPKCAYVGGRGWGGGALASGNLHNVHMHMH
jgi:hypothetical protein